jgi:hypothetical protein
VSFRPALSAEATVDFAFALSAFALSALPAKSEVTAFWAAVSRLDASPADGAESPLSRAIASMRGRARSRACVLSVIWNWRKADFCTTCVARSGSSMPGSSTMMRSSPTFWTTGSETPNSSMRLRTTRRALFSASLLFATVPFDSSTSSARCIPPCRSSPRLSGTRVTCFSTRVPSF